MANVNKVMLIGRLTRDPELKYLPSGTGVANADLAVNRFIPGKDGAEGKEKVCFIPLTVWGKQAESLVQYCKKGKEIHVEGYLDMDQWEDKETGKKRSKIKVVAERIQFLGAKSDNAAATQEEPAGESVPSGESDVPF